MAKKGKFNSIITVLILALSNVKEIFSKTKKQNNENAKKRDKNGQDV